MLKLGQCGFQLGSIAELPFFLDFDPLQVLFMVVSEILLSVFWEFCISKGYKAWNLVIEETINLLFFDVLVLPYLIFNK